MTTLTGAAPSAGVEAPLGHSFGGGWVAPAETFAGEAEAVTLVNGTEHRLAAMLFTGHAERSERVAALLAAGTVWVNCVFDRDLAAPFGGARRCGIDREGGAWSFDFFPDVKNVAVLRGTLREGSGQWVGGCWESGCAEFWR